MKWCEVAMRNQNARYEELSSFLKDKGVANQVEFISTDENSWQGQIESAMKSNDAIRIGPGLSELVLKIFNATELEARHLGASDTLLKEAGSWWPRSAAYQGLVHAVAEIGESFHLGTRVLIVGCGGLAKVSIAALFREGFTQFTIVAEDSARAERLIAQLRRSHLGAKFSRIEREGLILLPSEFGVCVNTIPATPENQFVPELSYFNFLIPEGLVIDFTLEEGVSPLVKEAEAIGGKALAGPRLFGHIDVHWVKMATGKQLSVDELSQRYLNKFQPKV